MAQQSRLRAALSGFFSALRLGERHGVVNFAQEYLDSFRAHAVEFP
jgi:hypothetical protein